MSIYHASKSITLETSIRMLDEAEKEAKKIGINVTICILDYTGRIKSYRSMDGAPPISHETSIKKAKTAAGFNLKTGEPWYEMMKNDPMMMIGVQHLPDFIRLGGGSPIIFQGQTGLRPAFHS